MSKFNQPTSIRKNLEKNKDATLNYEGELAFNLDPLTDLYTRTATTLIGENKFYESGKIADAELLDSINRVLKIDPKFVLQLAVYCREELYLRSVPLMLVAEYANSISENVPNSRKFITRVIQRADEITELLSYQWTRDKITPSGTKIPTSIKYGIREAFAKFNEYQFSKYNNEEKAVKFKDAILLTRPSGIDKERYKLYNKIVEDTLEMAETWEVMRSTGKMTWHDVIHNVFHKNGKVNNYMAILRNIRNIMTDKSVTKDDILLYANMLSDKNAVIHSKQFPYRFLSAYLVTQNIESPYRNIILNSLEEAVRYSTETLPKLDGITVIASDFSGSMRDIIGQRPTNRSLTWQQQEELKKYAIYRCDIGQLLSMIANQFCKNTITSIFGDKLAILPISKYSGILQTTVNMRNKAGQLVGCSTNGHLVPQYLSDNNIEVDRIFLFTDCQIWNSHDDRNFAVEFLKYQRKYPKVKLYCFDLSGYGTIMIPQDTKNTCLIGGWSDRIFDFVKIFEETRDNNMVIQKIKSIEP